MLFRIEDNENINGCHREYEIPFDNLPKMHMSELEKYLAEEIRKEVNNANDRKLLSYSKSLGVFLLKYNKYTDNELHINTQEFYDYICYYDCKKESFERGMYRLIDGVMGYGFRHKKREIILTNIVIDISDNILLDNYLNKLTGVGRKKMASPEKDKEVLMMQSPNDMVISDYSASVYLLYALFLRYGMKKSIYKNLINRISNLEDFRFGFCGEIERNALLTIINYLYYDGRNEIEMSRKVFHDSAEDEHISMYYDPILQLHGIQEDDFFDSYMLSDYNSNIVSDWVWHYYSEEYG